MFRIGFLYIFIINAYANVGGWLSVCISGLFTINAVVIIQFPRIHGSICEMSGLICDVCLTVTISGRYLLEYASYRAIFAGYAHISGQCRLVMLNMRIIYRNASYPHRKCDL